MILYSPGEVAFSIFNFPVYWYGIILACAILLGVVAAEVISRRFFTDVPKDFFVDNSPLFVIFGVLGARLYYCIINYQYYFHHAYEIFDIRQGGLSIHGMILAGILAVWFIARKNKINLLTVLDVLAPACILAQSVGRWGNFFNSEAFGLPNSWGVFIPVAKRPIEYLSYEIFHPTFLYESFLDLIIFLILIFVVKNSKKRGTVFFAYLILYSIARFCVEAVRIDSVLNLFGMPVAQIMSLLLALIGIIGLLKRN